MLTSLEAGAEVGVGQPAPWFDLEAMAGGRVSRRTITGKTAVLIVGRTQAAAPPCKEWFNALKSRAPAVYQVIVIDKPWYLPRGAVLSKIKGFVGDTDHDRVLLEWYKVFANAYGIPRDDDPRVLVLDRSGVVRLALRGKLEPSRLAQAAKAIALLERGAK